MTHVFIVNEQSFKIHLEYMFAGTGNAISNIHFLTNSGSGTVTSFEEKCSILMLADLERIRIGDNILFFVTGVSKFFGVFEAVSEVFVDDIEDNYLSNLTGKTLPYRILIKPKEVFSRGVSEYIVLDSLQGISRPQDMCWSLIYRKLKGNRGCTPITDFEFDRIYKLLKKENDNLMVQSVGYSYLGGQIVCTDVSYPYKGKMIDPHPSIFLNLYRKYSSNSAFEHYLQLFTINTLKLQPQNILSEKYDVCWIGNEVSCGVGMQRIDAMAIQYDECSNTYYLSIIELKDESIKEEIIFQIERYLKWLSDYIIPTYVDRGFNVVVEPIIICKKNKRKQDEIELSIKKHQWTRYCSLNVQILDTKIITMKDENGQVKI